MLNPRIALPVGLLLLAAGAARADAGPSSAVPEAAEKTLAAPRPSLPYLDYSNCPTPQKQQEVQLKAVLEVPDQDRGPVVAKGGCAVASNEPAPTTVDPRYSNE